MLRLRSPAFEDGERVPEHYWAERAGGTNDSIPLEWDGAPEGTDSYIVLMLDRHPSAEGFVHWAVSDIPGDAVGLPEGASGKRMPNGSREYPATTGKSGYFGPTPPPGSGDHRYEISVYALAVRTLGLPQDATADDMQDAMEGNVLDVATLAGVVGR